MARVISDIPDIKKVEINGLIIQVAIIPIIEIWPKVIAIIGIVASVADRDVLMLEHKNSGKNLMSKL